MIQRLYLLKGGHDTEDRRLDRLPQFDKRSRAFPIRELLTPKPLVTKTWRCWTWLDQGREGACVGFSWSHELAAEPMTIPLRTNDSAREIYNDAKKIDEWAGEDYSGTSVLAGAKVVQSRGYMPEYRWCFGIDDLVNTLSHHGPVVLGIPWLRSMFNPDAKGVLKVEGEVAGGHAILARGVLLKKFGRPVVRLRNSWGRDWGYDGDCFVYFEDMERLLKMDGDACVPVRRRRP